MERVKCPTCSAIQHVESSAVAYTCALCSSEWTWAACLGCARLELALTGQESWKCSRCGRYTRSWWRSTSAALESSRIVGLRVELRAGHARARQVAPRRRRRRVTAVVAGTIALAGSAAAVVLSASGTSTAAHDRAACVAFADARSTIANGGLEGDEITQLLGGVSARATQGSPAIAAAVQNLQEAGRPGTATFLVAQTKLLQVCG